MTLKEVITKLEERPHIEPKVVYSKQERVTAKAVLDRLVLRTSANKAPAHY